MGTRNGAQPDSSGTLATTIRAPARPAPVTQAFRPLRNNDLILGAVGVLQFDVAAHRLKGEYGVEAVVEPIGVQAARWVVCKDDKELRRFREKAHENLAEDGDGQLVYLAPTRVNLNLTIERWPDVQFLATREL